MFALPMPRIYSDAQNLFKGGEDDQKLPIEGQSYLGSAFGGTPLGATGIFAALDMKTNRLVWQQRWKEPCYSGSVTSVGGLTFVRGQKRRAANRPEFLERSTPVGVPDWGGRERPGQCVRIRR